MLKTLLRIAIVILFLPALAYAATTSPQTAIPAPATSVPATTTSKVTTPPTTTSATVATTATAPAVNNLPIVAGKDYEVIPPGPSIKSPPAGKIEVVEFFNYGCPACYHLELVLEPWLAKKSQDVVFERMPVIFHFGWDMLARAYYTAKNLGVAEKLTPVFFTAVQVQGLNLTTDATIGQFFVAHGVSQKDFESAYHFTPGIDAQMTKADTLARAYNIFEVPTLVVDGKYKTNVRMTGGDNKRLLQVLDYLIAQERAGVKKSV